MNIKKYNILGSEISAVKLEKLGLILKKNNYSVTKYICISNVHTVITGRSDKKLQNATNNSWISLADGKPLSVVGNFFYGKNKFERVTGPGLMKFLINNSKELNITHYFYGSTKDTIEKLKQKLKDNNYVKGFKDPPFRKFTKNEIKEHFSIINKTNPKIVWVALGAPKQEKFMLDNLKYLKSGIMIGVGAAFDYYAGNIKRAPLWMQKMSLEWFFRLIQEPQRLWKRYLITNTQFMYLATIELLRHYAKKLL